MRAVLFSVVLFAACDQQDGATPYDAYDPDAVAMNDMMEDAPVQVSEAEGAWVHPDGVVLAGFTAPTMGRWTVPGVEPGLEAGDAAGQALGGDHVCTDKELDAAYEAGDFEAAGSGRDMWLFHPGDESGHCLNWTYQGAHIADGNYSRSRRDNDGMRLDAHIAPPSKLDGDCLSNPELCPSTVPSGFPCNVERSIACCNE